MDTPFSLLNAKKEKGSDGLSLRAKTRDSENTII